MRKITSLMVAVVIMLCYLPTIASAKSMDSYVDFSPQGIHIDGPELPKPEALPEDYTQDYDIEPAEFKGASAVSESDAMYKLSELIKEALLTGKKEISIANYGYTLASHPRLVYIDYYCPYVNGSTISTLLYYDSSKSNYPYSAIKIANSLSLQETKAMIVKVDESISRYLATVSDSSLSDIDIALKLHDEIVANCEYDTNYDSELEKNDNTFYYSNRMFLKGDGVCQAYALMYMHLLTKKGIQSGYAISDGMNHGWNFVLIDGNYYHVDATWDDPIEDKLGNVYHSYFMVSDSAMATKREGLSNQYHFGWAPNYSCSSTKYDNAYWYLLKASSKIIKKDNYLYFVSNEGLVKYDINTKSSELIDDLGKWPTLDGRGNYVGKFAALFEAKNCLIYNTATELRVLSLRDDTFSRINYAIDTSTGYIYGCKKSGYNLVYSLKASPSGKGTLRTVNNLFTEQGALVNNNITIKSINLSLLEDGMLGINFYIEDKSELDTGASVSIGLADKWDENVTTRLSQNKVYSQTQSTKIYKVSFLLNSGEMTIPIKISVSDQFGDGIAQATYSVKDYSDEILKKYSSKYRDSIPLIKAMLNYGAASQKYFAVNSDNLANNILDSADRILPSVPEKEPDYNAQIDGNIENVDFIGTSLVLDSAISLRYYFVISDKVNDELSFEYNNKTLDLKDKNNVQYIEVSGIRPWNLENDCKVNVRNNISGENMELSYSPIGYIYQASISRTDNEQFMDMINALYNYQKAAKSYAESK